MVVYRIKNLGVFDLKWDVCVTPNLMSQESMWKMGGDCKRERWQRIQRKQCFLNITGKTNI